MSKYTPGTLKDIIYNNYALFADDIADCDFTHSTAFLSELAFLAIAMVNIDLYSTDAEFATFLKSLTTFSDISVHYNLD